MSAININTDSIRTNIDNLSSVISKFNDGFFTQYSFGSTGSLLTCIRSIERISKDVATNATYIKDYLSNYCDEVESIENGFSGQPSTSDNPDITRKINQSRDIQFANIDDQNLFTGFYVIKPDDYQLYESHAYDEFFVFNIATVEGLFNLVEYGGDFALICAGYTPLGFILEETGLVDFEDMVEKQWVKSLFDEVYESTGLDQCAGFDDARSAGNATGENLPIIVVSCVNPLAGASLAAATSGGRDGQAVLLAGGNMDEASVTSVFSAAWAFGTNYFGAKAGNLGATSSAPIRIGTDVVFDALTTDLEISGRVGIRALFAEGYYDENGEFIEFKEDDTLEFIWEQVYDDMGGDSYRKAAVTTKALVSLASSAYGEYQNYKDTDTLNIMPDTFEFVCEETFDDMGEDSVITTALTSLAFISGGANSKTQEGIMVQKNYFSDKNSITIDVIRGNQTIGDIETLMK